MSLPPNPNQNPVPNRTPFDDDLLNDPNAPRHTQPLPAPQQSAPSSTGNALPSGPSAVAPSLPPQVAVNGTAAKTTNTTSLSERRFPLSVIVGLAMVGGALLVILVSMALGKLMPRSNNQKTAQTTLKTPTPSAPQVVMVPPSTPDANNLPTPQQPANSLQNDVSPDNSTTPDISSPDGAPTPNSSDADTSTPDTSDTDSPDADATPQTNASQTSAPDGVYRSRKRNYSIRPPKDFRIVQSGRRTAWHGPQDTKLLVEIGAVDSSSPRKGWEKLDRALQKKYGAKYQNGGIRETTINGRQAAVWEFDLELKSGRVHKMDVAIHEGNRGFAVLATAPADDFENWRTRFENTIQSLQIESKDAKSTETPDAQNSSNETAEGY